MYPSNDELREIIADAENKIGYYHAIILSKKILIAALKELIQRRSAAHNITDEIDEILKDADTIKVRKLKGDDDKSVRLFKAQGKYKGEWV